MSNTSNTVTKPILTYFNVLGRAELARLMLEDAGVDYDYVTFTMRSGWNEHKAKLTAEDKLAFGQVPLYEEPGLTLVQSSAIARHLARKHGYNGANAREEALIDQAHEGVVDLLNDIAKVVFFMPEGEQQAAAKEKLVRETLPSWLTSFEKLIVKNGDSSGFLVGSKLSYADLNLWVALQLVFIYVEGTSVDSLLGGFPAVKKLHTTIEERERIKEYLARDVYAK